MSYDSTRISEQLRVLEPEIHNFILRYNASTGPAGGLPRQTVFMFPGGMASRLMRARTAFNPTGPLTQVFAYDELWVNATTLLGGEARNLRMTKVAPGDYRDTAGRIVIADGLTNLFGATPYLGFTTWGQAAQLDYFVFPWDWRRSVDDVGDFFIRHFLPRFRNLVRAGCNNADPLVRFSLIGHSAGGMVVNWALRSGQRIMRGLHKAITVGTPFYGYGGQLHRWFEGESYLNGPFDVFKSDIIRMICSLPGCYAWSFLPYATYLRISGELAADPYYPLRSYPSVDHASGKIADPYNPQTTGSRGRYPSATSGFDLVELAAAEMLVTFLASPLTSRQAAKFWNIRGDNAAGNTPNRTRWEWVPPTDPCPITDDTRMTAGDGVQPAWTTRHVDLDALPFPHVITIQSSLAQHAEMMSEPQTLLAITNILMTP